VAAFVKIIFILQVAKTNKKISAAVKGFCHDQFQLRTQMMKLTMNGHIAYLMLVADFSLSRIAN